MVRRRAHRRRHAVDRRRRRAIADLFRPIRTAADDRGADTPGDLYLYRLLGRTGSLGDAGFRAGDVDRPDRLYPHRAPLQSRSPTSAEILRLGVPRRRPGPADIK